MLHAIVDQISKLEKPIIKIIFRNDNTRVVAFGLKEGLKLIDHQLPVDAKIMMLKGEIEIDSKIEVVNLKTYDEYEIPRKVIHQVTSKQDAMMLVILNFSEKKI
ncbi:hypothetical protein [Empedobacter brevis]|uniref:Cupin 2 conserved barrel domain-containing protein n=1 Tax=Empedobacter brevis NBRC 14943 = ATCC 43319 TaxID=1218108 RepID=A0A511NL53_9FLAO|nr:hypothetical protein [Empedobacter brevis]GEM53532.1 hypothetical protein EB1_33220 [Empedobacter brevis NBRC 14943 = ATCC 43319]